MVDTHNDVSGTVSGPLIQARDVVLAPGASHARSGLPPIGPVTGRDVELRALAAILEPDSTAPAVSVVAGLAGVGKTTLVIRAAHDARAKEWFPGGVFFLDLRGYDPHHAVHPEVALATLLRAMGVPHEQIPPDQAGREILYRSMLNHAEPTLVVLDNASSTLQIRPLLPSADHRVLVTSRHTLADITGARLIDLGVLEQGEAEAFVRTALRAANPHDNRVTSQPEAVEEIIRLCGNLPLALTIVAAILAGDPDQPVAELAEALSDNVTRLSELSFGDNLGVRAAFDLSYQRLTPDEARLFRMVSLDPGQQVSTHAAAALADLSERDAAKLLTSLRRAHMLEPGERRGWFRYHDLLRLYAEEQAVDEPERAAAEVRLLAYYIAVVEQRNVMDSSGRYARWLESERGTLVRVALLADKLGRPESAMRLVFGLSDFLLLHGYLNDCDVLFPIALTAARSVGNRLDVVYALRNSGELAWERHDDDSARAHYGDLLAVSREAGNPVGEALARRRLGAVLRRAGDPRGADAHLTAALQLDRRLKDWRGEVDTLLLLGKLARERGRDEVAVGHYLRVLELALDHHDLGRERRVLAATAHGPQRRSAFMRLWWSHAVRVYVGRGRAERARVLVELLGGARG